MMSHHHTVRGKQASSDACSLLRALNLKFHPIHLFFRHTGDVLETTLTDSGVQQRKFPDTKLQKIQKNKIYRKNNDTKVLREGSEPPTSGL